MRRKTIVSASASAGVLALALGAVLTGCGGSDREGYVATGAAGPGTPRSTTVPPQGGVELFPLAGGQATPTPEQSPAAPSAATAPLPDPPTTSDGPAPAPPTARSPVDTGSGSPSSGPHTRPAPGPGPDGSSPSKPRPKPPPKPSKPSKPPTGTPPAPPAKLTHGEPRREPDERRWCEKVTLTFTNSGGRPVTDGTVTFGTHVIGPLGTDWSTITSSRPLRADRRGRRRKRRGRSASTTGGCRRACTSRHGTSR
ncbi:hypothetical protein ACFQ2B_16520 [Streptomyces stramineus]